MSYNEREIHMIKKKTPCSAVVFTEPSVIPLTQNSKLGSYFAKIRLKKCFLLSIKFKQNAWYQADKLCFLLSRSKFSNIANFKVYHYPS